MKETLGSILLSFYELHRAGLMTKEEFILRKSQILGEGFYESKLEPGEVEPEIMNKWFQFLKQFSRMVKSDE